MSTKTFQPFHHANSSDFFDDIGPSNQNKGNRRVLDNEIHLPTNLGHLSECPRKPSSTSTGASCRTSSAEKHSSNYTRKFGESSKSSTGYGHIPTRQRTDGVKQNSLFRGTLEPTQWRWKCSQVRVKSENERSCIHAFDTDESTQTFTLPLSSGSLCA